MMTDQTDHNMSLIDDLSNEFAIVIRPSKLKHFLKLIRPWAKPGSIMGASRLTRIICMIICFLVHHEATVLCKANTFLHQS